MNTKLCQSGPAKNVFCLAIFLTSFFVQDCLAGQRDTLVLPPARDSVGFVWGANGHPMNQIAYRGNLTEQIAVLSNIGLSYYRVDMDQAVDGTIRDPSAARLEELIRLTSAAHISIVPVLFPPFLSTLYEDSDFEKKYNNGFFAGKKFALSFGKSFHYYELGNENDVQLIGRPFDDGADSAQYNMFRLKCLAASLRGMENGINAIDPSAQIIISNAGWMHYAYFRLLESEGVRIDIIGYHWYEDVGHLKHVLHILRSDFANKPVWFTEVNRRADSVDHFGKQNRRIKRYITALHRSGKNVKGFFVYELFDQPASTPKERAYGMVNWRNRYTTYTYKPFALTLRAAIKKYRLHPNE